MNRKPIAEGQKGKVYGVSNRNNLVAKQFSYLGLSDIAKYSEFPIEFSQYETIPKFQSQLELFIKKMTIIADEINATVKQDLAKDFWPKDQNLPIFCIGPLGPEEYKGKNYSKNLVFYKYVVKDQNLKSNEYKTIHDSILDPLSPGCNSLMPFLVFLFNLSRAHKNGYYHRDIHKGNIICKDNYIYLIDLDGMLMKYKSQYQGLLDFVKSIDKIMFIRIADHSKKDDTNLTNEFLQKILYLILEIMLMFFFLESGKFLSPQDGTNFLLFFERHLIFKLASYYLNYIQEKLRNKYIDGIIYNQLETTFLLTSKFKEFTRPYNEFMSKCNFFKNFIRRTFFQRDIIILKNQVNSTNLYNKNKYNFFSAMRYNVQLIFNFLSKEISGQQFFYIVSIFEKSSDITTYTKLSTYGLEIFVDLINFERLKSKVIDVVLSPIL